MLFVRKKVFITFIECKFWCWKYFYKKIQIFFDSYSTLFFQRTSFKCDKLMCKWATKMQLIFQTLCPLFNINICITAHTTWLSSTDDVDSENQKKRIYWKHSLNFKCFPLAQRDTKNVSKKKWNEMSSSVMMCSTDARVSCTFEMSQLITQEA